MNKSVLILTTLLTLASLYGIINYNS